MGGPVPLSFKYVFKLNFSQSSKHAPGDVNTLSIIQVCLSLLGTWTGKGTEQWTKASNLLQLFISIQSLVLNSTPYYNEVIANYFYFYRAISMMRKLIKVSNRVIK